jgi:hypothetical protein
MMSKGLVAVVVAVAAVVVNAGQKVKMRTQSLPQQKSKLLLRL